MGILVVSVFCRHLWTLLAVFPVAVFVPGSNTALDSSLTGKTFRESGLTQPVTLHITCLQDEDTEV